MEITKGIIARPKRIGVYGPEGIGKTTLAAQVPDPLFIDVESGSVHMDVKRTIPKTFEELISDIQEVRTTPGICKTLVIDTADRVDEMAADYVCRKHKVKGIESFGYGKGYVFLGETFADFLKALDGVVEAGIGVIVTAHAKLRKFEQPDEMGAYDRWEMKLSKQAGPLLKEWTDALLFCSYKTVVVNTENGKVKAQGGKRVIYTNHHPCWDAKNRFGLPDEMPLSYDSIRTLFESGGAVESLKARIKADGVEETALQALIASRGICPEGTPIDSYSEKVCNWIGKNWSAIIKTIN